MGTLDKLYLLFDEPFWPTRPTWLTTPQTTLPQGQLNHWMNLHPYVQAPILLGFNGGPSALELAKMSDQKAHNRSPQYLSNRVFRLKNYKI